MKHWRLAAYLLVVAMSMFGHWRIEQTRLDDKAQDCVTSWMARADTRDMSEKVYRRTAETLISLAVNATPDRVAMYEDLIERDVDEIRATLPNPDCDLDTARDRLDQ